MQTVIPPLFTIAYLQSLVTPNGAWFKENSPEALAGRCLLDSMEYLRADLTIPGQFRQLANAHAVRLLTICLSDESVRLERLKRMGRRINEVLQLLQANRNSDPPFYGDDYWDWSAILDCFLEVNQRLSNSIITKDVLESEMGSFKKEVEAKLRSGLVLHSEDEWYGPATAAAAHRVLTKWAVLSNRNLHATLDQLKKQALQPITKDGKYRKHRVNSALTLWHYGQVVSEFPTESAPQKKMMKDLNALPQMPAMAFRVYALARVVQGAHGVGDNKTMFKAVNRLYECQNLSRPLGQGLLGDEVKGSLNVLEAIWPTLQPSEKKRIGSMVEALTDAHSRANTVGVLVAIEPEFHAVQKAFADDGATVDSASDVTKLTFSHPEYRAVVRLGKAHVDTSDATRKLLVEDQAQWLFMLGIAGSLGTPRGAGPDSRATHVGPDLGDVVLAACLAPHNIRAKVREVSENAPVPFRGLNWTVIPTNPALFASALKAASKVFPKDGPDKVKVYEGTIVTGHLTDSPQGKADLLSELPGGLAIEEEGYIFALLCLNEERPYMVVRGISDFAGGDKKKEDEEERKTVAAERAAQVTVEAIKILSRRW